VRAADRTRLGAAVLLVVLLMFPVYWMLRTSVASTAELSTVPVPLWPQDWDLANYVEPWRQYPFARWLTNSVVVAVVSVVLTVSINLAAGWAFAKLRFPGRDLLFLLILSTLMVPVQVIMIPQFQVVIEMGLLDNPMGVVLPRLAEAFGLFLARQFFLSVPTSWWTPPPSTARGTSGRSSRSRCRCPDRWSPCS
jgi:ABC-type glycerol-3-phosphate transport system permease component